MITGPQIREARRLLQWSLGTLAQKAQLDSNLIWNAEQRSDAAVLTTDQHVALVEAFQEAGVTFLPGFEDESAVRWCWTVEPPIARG